MIRLLADDGVGAAEGLAVDEALMGGYGREAADRPPTLRLYTYRPSAALVGRFQDVEAEVDLQACSAQGASVNRRLTGGGAIVMGPAQLGVALVRRAPVRLPARHVLGEFAGALSAALATLGIEAALGGKNDLLADGRKIAGLGLHVDDAGALLLHASVLADLDVEHMLGLLRIPVAKLGGAGTAAVRRRITTVTEQTGRPYLGESLRGVVADGFARSLGAQLVEGSLDGSERERAVRCEARYRDPEWIHPARLSRQQRGSALLRTPAGLLRCYAASQGGVVSHLTFVGDVLAMPEALLKLEADLRWSRADADSVTRLVQSAGAAAELGCSAGELATLVLQALGAQSRAEASESSYPVRITGSCYFPAPAEAGAPTETTGVLR